MLFNSHEFIIFLILVFSLYWYVFGRNRRAQNILLLIASYVFYGWWDYRFLSLIILSSFIDYFSGIAIGSSREDIRRKLFLGISLASNLGLLGFFKYYNFFISEFISLCQMIGLNAEYNSISVILPVGISFYTFQTMSYTIDVYRRELIPTRDVVGFFAYVSFFPQLVAGPIERAANLLPQFSCDRKFQYSTAVDGLKQILWGLLKKVVIADGAARYVNPIFSNYQNLSSSTVALGIVLFAFQIYGDFSGYSDIAIGTAKLFGFRLMKNFATPYFSRDIAEFWRRWHISLSTWFRDYVYIPMGGSRGPTRIVIRNTLALFLLSGLWHGANWTFIVWGLLNALYFVPYKLTKTNRKNLGIVAEGKLLPSISELMQITVTFSLTCFAWVFFRASSVHEACDIISRLFDPSFFSKPGIVGGLFPPLLCAFIIVEWIQREKEHGLVLTGIKNRIFRWSLYYGCAALVFFYFNYQQSFIYFQF